MLVTATPSPARHGAHCLAFDEPERHQAAWAYAERAQQRPSLTGAEVDTASNQGGVNRTPGLAVTVAVDVGLEPLHIALGIVAAAVVAEVVVYVVVVRVVRVVLPLQFVLRAADVEVFAH